MGEGALLGKCSTPEYIPVLEGGVLFQLMGTGARLGAGPLAGEMSSLGPGSSWDGDKRANQRRSGKDLDTETGGSAVRLGRETKGSVCLCMTLGTHMESGGGWPCT